VVCFPLTAPLAPCVPNLLQPCPSTTLNGGTVVNNFLPLYLRRTLQLAGVAGATSLGSVTTSGSVISLYTAGANLLQYSVAEVSCAAPRCAAPCCAALHYAAATWDLVRLPCKQLHA